MMSLRLVQNLELRQTLVQKLGLESEFLESCLVRTEARLKESRHQRGLALLRGIVDESEFRSVLDWLLALYAPSYAGEIRSFYEDGGKRLIDSRPWRTIDEVDRILDEEIVRLGDLHKEVWMLGLYAADKEARELVDMYLEMFARPRFAMAA
jgi:hypothetical protein